MDRIELDKLWALSPIRESKQSIFLNEDIPFLINFSDAINKAKNDFSLKKSFFVFIDKNRAIRDLSQSFYEFQNSIRFGKSITLQYKFESSRSITDADIHLRVFQDINDIFKNFIKTYIIYYEQNINHMSFAIDVSANINLPITNTIFNYLDFNVLRNRNTISDKFEYLLFKFFNRVGSFSHSAYYKYLNKITALFITNFIVQSIINDLINLFLDKNLNFIEKINSNKEFQLEFYFPNYFKDIRNLGIPEHFISKIYPKYIAEQVKEHIQEIFICYLKILDFEKLLNDSYLKNNLKQSYKIKSIIDAINNIDFHINPDLNIIIIFDKFKKYLKNNQSKISFKKKRI